MNSRAKTTTSSRGKQKEVAPMQVSQEEGNGAGSSGRAASASVACSRAAWVDDDGVVVLEDSEEDA